MANSIGAKAVAYVNGYDLSTGISQVDVDYPADAVDVTPYQNTARTFLTGLENGNISVTGYYDSSAGAIDNVLSAMIGGTAMWVVYEQGDVLGNRGHAIYGFETDYKVTAPVASAIGVTATAQSNHGPKGIVSIIPKQTVSSSGAGTVNFTAVDYGTNLSGGTTSTGGARSFLQVFSGNGTAQITVNVQHGTAAVTGQTTFMTHTAFVAGSAPTYDYQTFASGTTINEFIRGQVVFPAGGTVVLAVGVTRYP